MVVQTIVSTVVRSMDQGENYLVRLLETGSLAPDELDSLVGWWHATRTAGEELVVFLIRQGVFVTTARKTVSMMQKGYVSSGVGPLLAEQGLNRLRGALSAAGSPTASHRVTQSTRSAVARPNSSDTGPLTLLTTRNAANSPRITTPVPTSTTQSAPISKTASIHGIMSGPRGAPPTASGRSLGSTTGIPNSLLHPVALSVTPPVQIVRPASSASSGRNTSLAPTVAGPTQRGGGRPPKPPNAPVLEIGGTLGKCLLTEKIGQGASGLVFRALHKSLNIPVAIKVIQAELLENDPLLHQQFRSEARLLAQLNHPNVVRVLDFEDETAYPYLVLEYVEGLSLAELINQSGRLRLDRAVKIIVQVAEGLAAARRLGIVHRDVKPANILLAKDGSAKLADLGLAVVIGGNAAGTASGGLPPDTMAGTAAYMSPEQAVAAASVDHRSDLYSLGVTLFHALTGQLPFKGRTRMEVMLKHVQEKPQPPHELVPELDPHVSAIVLKMMAKDPGERYQTYEELITAMTAVPLRPTAHPVGASGASSVVQCGTPAPSGSVNSQRRSVWQSLFGLKRGAAGAGATPPPT